MMTAFACVNVYAGGAYTTGTPRAFSFVNADVLSPPFGGNVLLRTTFTSLPASFRSPSASMIAVFVRRYIVMCTLVFAARIDASICAPSRGCTWMVTFVLVGRARAIERPGHARRPVTAGSGVDSPSGSGPPLVPRRCCRAPASDPPCCKHLTRDARSAAQARLSQRFCTGLP